VLWCLAHCASTGISLAMAVGLALVSHRNFQVRNGHRCQHDHRDAVWNAYGARTIGALPCSIACARGGVHDDCSMISKRARFAAEGGKRGARCLMC
jgi:hypothetical protein